MGTTADGSYDGAGDGKCLAIKSSDGTRCTNGVYQSNLCCGTHKRATEVTLAVDEDDREWFRCSDCGWQPSPPTSSTPTCSLCGAQIDTQESWANRELEVGN